MTSVPTKAVKSERITQLDGVRTLAIGSVFLHHAFSIRLLWAGVDLFFILSGFLITGILIGAKGQPMGRYFSHFYERRARRILPPYVLLLVLTTLLLGFGWMHAAYMYLFLMNMFFAFHVSAPSTLLVLWSLAVEEQFYLVWPFVVFFLSETAIAWTAGGLLLAAPILRWLCTPLFAQHWVIYEATPFRMDLLAMGALLAVLWRRRRDLFTRWGVYGPIASVLAIGVLFLLSRNPHFNTIANTRESNVWIYELCLIACTGIILWALSGRYVRVLQWAPITYLGRISYSIYLIHATILLLLTTYIHSVWARGLLGGLIAVVYAALSWQFLEKPILYWKARSATRKEAEADEHAITASSR